ncbi:MAG: UDP-N-acetylmuramate--L-alanine ligase [Elusimicrobia bacterium]|nr:UDP-N-acetylmuramate--L-alanine ligase [Elusimicrobiota bacterium]
MAQKTLVDAVRAKQRIHFVGIGGVGMSGIAEVLLNLGYKVSGSDLQKTEVTEKLSSLGAVIYKSHAAKNIRNTQVVVTSTAIAAENPEVLEAKRRKIPLIRRAEMLAEIARLKRTITVSGSHGKTTTTAMTALALKAAGADPTMIIGGRLKNIGSNAKLGGGDFLVAEADESDGSFLLLSPEIAVVTNIDTDHLDYYGSFGKLKAAFLLHISKVPFYGRSVLCADDPHLASLFPKLQRPFITYGLSSRADWTARSIKQDFKGSIVEVSCKGKKLGRLSLRVSGRYNLLNALGALACGHALGFDFKKLARGLSEFSGVGRRLEVLGKAGGVLFMDDYGHHPTEIRATLENLDEFWPHKRLIVVFQPHRYSRTKILARDFGPAFQAADAVYVAPIYAAGEKPIPGVTRDLILESIRKNRNNALPFNRTVEIARELRAGDLVLTLGAGDIWKVGEDLKRRLQSRNLTPL